MNIETVINSSLWFAIRRNYESGNWTNSILDAIHFLSDVIREKSSLEGDGAALIGQAFGGKTPKIRINRLETESERNIQSGLEQILRGIYQGIRNPRSHERVEDKRENCDAIIIFINYLIQEIGAAKASFSIQKCIDQILDKGFASNERYCDLLISEIPSKHYLTVAIEAFDKCEHKAENLRSYYKSLFKVMKPEDILEFYQVISDRLRETTNFQTIKSVFQFLAPEDWPQISEIARIRIENYLLEDLENGKYDISQKKCLSGALATWGIAFWKQFSNKQEILKVLIRHFSSDDLETSNYAIKFYFDHIRALVDILPSNLERLIIKQLQKGDQRFADSLGLAFFIDEKFWSKDVIDALNKFKPAENANFFGDVPF